MLIKKVKLCNKDATAYASDDSPSLTLLCGWCYTFLTNTTDKLQCKSKITWKPQDLPLSRAWWWCHFYKAEHVKIKSRGQAEEMGEERRDGLLCPIKQPSLFFWPLAVHYSQLLGWMHFFFLFRIILRSPIKKIPIKQEYACSVFLWKNFRVIRKQKEYIWPAI